MFTNIIKYVLIVQYSLHNKSFKCNRILNRTAMKNISIKQIILAFIINIIQRKKKTASLNQFKVKLKVMACVKCIISAFSGLCRL